MQVFAFKGKASASCMAAPKPNCFSRKKIVSPQLGRIMKLTGIILLAACLQVSAKGITQTVSISVKDAPFIQIIKLIERQTNYAFFYKVSWLNDAKKVTVKAVNMPLKEALDICFKDQPFTYVISGRNITIKPKDSFTSTEEKSPPVDVTGRVVDANGQPVAGATVSIKGSSKTTLTNADGSFAISGVEENAVVVISHVQYEMQSLTINGRSIVNATLKIKVSSLDEMQIIAYGATTKRLNTGNVSSVKAGDIQKQPVSNPLLALQGRVPGLFVEQANGVPGSGVTVRIQGINSLSRGSDPLYVIDGVPYVSQMLLGIGSLQGRSGSNGTGNPFSYINPADIESIEVLKDADATSIYGSRAAAGAILITTKKGKTGKTSVDLNLQKGWGNVAHFMDLLNTEQYLEMRMEAKANDNASINSTDYDLNGAWDKNRYTDWQKELIGGSSKYTDAQMSVSGGSGSTSFLVGGGYHRETTVFPGDKHDEKSSLHLNVNHTASNQRFHFQIDGKYLVNNNRLFNTDLTGNAVQLAPNAPALYDSNGDLNWATTSSGVSTWLNPLAYLLNTYKGRVNNLLGNAVVSYRILPKLEIKANLGYTNLSRNEIVLMPLMWNAPEIRPTTLSYSSFGRDLITSWIVEPQVTYKTSIHKGSLEALIGTTFQKNESSQQQIDASGFTSDLLLEDVRSASTITPGLTEASVYRYNAVFARLNYNWQNKYIVNLTARRDGSSRFGSENLFNTFWSAAGAWIFSNEKFIRNTLPFLSFGKLRVSYGTTGSDQIGDYQFMNLYSSRSRTVPYQGATGLNTTTYVNPYLEWEETRKFQAGLDLGFWSDRILIGATHFLNRSSNQLLSYSLPLLTGSPNVFMNMPATIQNSGWEFSLNTTNIQSRNFKWISSVNLTIPKNKLVNFDNLARSTLGSRLVIGQPFTIQRQFHSVGVDPATGLFSFLDNNGNFTSNPVFPADATVLINTAPEYYGGFQNNVTYKGFALDFLFQFVKQIGKDYSLGNQPGRFISDNTGPIRGNQPASVMNRWQKPGDNAAFQRFSTTYTSFIGTAYIRAGQSDMTFVDASFIRLKNVAVSWQLPEKLRKKAHLQNARFYTQGQNLWTITNYTGLDPETKSTNSLPPLRVWTFGVQVTF